jgi:hypothetical protein
LVLEFLEMREKVFKKGRGDKNCNIKIECDYTVCSLNRERLFFGKELS